jgi:hypothetical protein
MAVRQHLTPVLGSEVTTPASGHFNALPLSPGGPPIDARAPDWPVLGEAIRRAGTDPIIILNHGRDLHGGFRPLDPISHVGVTGEALDGQTLPVNAMEVVNSSAIVRDPMLLVRDWMGLLNRGYRIVPIGSSDSHDVARHFVGQGRTYVRCDDRDPGAIALQPALQNLRNGRVLVSYGLLTEITVGNAGDLAPVPSGPEILVRARVKGPSWVSGEGVTLYVNGVPTQAQRINDGARAGTKWEGVFRVPRPAGDVFVVAVATGAGIRAPYWPTAKPFQTTSPEFTAYTLGASGAVFIDVNGNGAFESAFEQAGREVAAAGDMTDLARRLRPHDRAVGAQAASVLRSQRPADFVRSIATLLEQAAPETADGVRMYLTAWQESQAARARKAAGAP